MNAAKNWWLAAVLVGAFFEVVHQGSAVAQGSKDFETPKVYEKLDHASQQAYFAVLRKYQEHLVKMSATGVHHSPEVENVYFNRLSNRVNQLHASFSRDFLALQISELGKFARRDLSLSLGRIRGPRDDTLSFDPHEFDPVDFDSATQNGSNRNGMNRDFEEEERAARAVLSAADKMFKPNWLDESISKMNVENEELIREMKLAHKEYQTNMKRITDLRSQGTGDSSNGGPLVSSPFSGGYSMAAMLAAAFLAHLVFSGRSGNAGAAMQSATAEVKRQDERLRRDYKTAAQQQTSASPSSTNQLSQRTMPN